MTAAEDRRNEARSRGQRVGQQMHLDVRRFDVKADLDHLTAAAMWTEVARLADEQADLRGEMARVEGASYADVAHVLDMSRQGARKRYGHLEVVS